MSANMAACCSIRIPAVVARQPASMDYIPALVMVLVLCVVAEMCTAHSAHSASSHTSMLPSVDMPIRVVVGTCRRTLVEQTSVVFVVGDIACIVRTMKGTVEPMHPPLRMILY